MAGTLQGDQRALLQLLYERGQSYEDISGLLGVSTEEVRERARAALEAIGGANPDAEVPLTDFLLGKADPIGRADVVRHLQGDPETLALAERIQAALTLLAPDAKPAKLPEPRGKARRAALPVAGEQDSRPESELGGVPSTDPVTAPGASGGNSARTRTIAILAGLGVILLVVVLAVAGVFGEGDDAAEGDNATAASGRDAGEDEITSVDLRPVDGSGVAATAVFRLLGGEQLVIDLNAQGLDPSPPEGSAYLLWLVVGERAGYPVSTPLQPDQNGSFQNTIEVPTEVAVTFGSQATAVRLTQTPLNELRREVRAAAEREVPILPVVGTELANGEIPLVGRQGRKRGGESGTGAGGG